MLKRIILYLMGILLLATGLVLNARAGLGVSSISTFPYVWDILAESLTYGQTTMFIYFIYITAQFMLYRKIVLKVVLQIPFSYIFGLLVDAITAALNYQPRDLAMQIVLMMLGILFMGLGAYLIVIVDFVMNPADGMVNALSYVSHKNFGQVKSIFDVFTVLTSLVISLIFSGKFIGFGMGTIFAALTIGRLINYFGGLLNEHLVPEIKASQVRYKF